MAYLRREKMSDQDSQDSNARLQLAGNAGVIRLANRSTIVDKQHLRDDNLVPHQSAQQRVGAVRGRRF